MRCPAWLRLAMMWLRASLAASVLWAFPQAIALDTRAAENDATCQCLPVDYADSGSYLIDGNADGNFKFASTFEGKKHFGSFQNLYNS